MIARGFAFISGALILSAVAHVTVMATGGYGTPHSWLTLAIAFGVACGSVVSGMARTRRLAAFFILCIAGGEIYGVMQTANRLVAASEASQAPLIANNEARAKATTRVTEAEARLRGIPATSDRLKSAEAAKTAADKAVVDKSAERGCRENCRQLLQAQVTAAADEIATARAELDNSTKSAEIELASAREALASLKAPESATPLADRTGIPAWILDLLTAGLGSIAANGLACCLMIFGAHHTRSRVEVLMTMPIAQATAITDQSRTVRKVPTAKDHAARYAVECMRPGGEADLQDIQARYATWSTEHAPDVTHAPSAVAHALADLFEAAGIDIAQRNGRLVAIGISLKERTEAIL
jgi:hypothetical protein